MTRPICGRRPGCERRRNKIVEEIQANRRGEFTVPTWVLAMILLLLLAGWAAIVIVS